MYLQIPKWVQHLKICLKLQIPYYHPLNELLLGTTHVHPTCCYISLHAPMHSACPMHPYAPYISSSAKVPLHTSMCFLCTLCAPMCHYMPNMYLIHTPTFPYVPLHAPMISLCAALYTYVTLCTPPPICTIHVPVCALHIPFAPPMVLCTPMCLSVPLHAIHTLHAPLYSYVPSMHPYVHPTCTLYIP